MTDYTELKRLAEAATPGVWSECGSYVAPIRKEGATVYVESWRSIAAVPADRDREFIAAANPAAVLALIAENERLRSKQAINLRAQAVQVYCRVTPEDEPK